MPIVIIAGNIPSICTPNNSKIVPIVSRTSIRIIVFSTEVHLHKYLSHHCLHGSADPPRRSLAHPPTALAGRAPTRPGRRRRRRSRPLPTPGSGRIGRRRTRSRSLAHSDRLGHGARHVGDDAMHAVEPHAAGTDVLVGIVGPLDEVLPQPGLDGGAGHGVTPTLRQCLCPRICSD